jgi:import inner membrane translocase subunit TIM22
MEKMSYDSTFTPQAQAIKDLPMKDQLRHTLKDMGSRSYRSAKNFSVIGASFAFSECTIEGVRVRNMPFPV